MAGKSQGGDIKNIALASLGSIVVTLVGAYLVTNRDVVKKEDLPGLISQYSPYTADAKLIQQKLDELNIQQAKMAEDLKQMQIDTARISEKIGVTASPGVYNTHPTQK